MQGLLIDYGGVLTTPVTESMTAWAGDDGIDYERFRAVLGEWFGSAYGEHAPENPVHAVERGEITVPQFERELAARLRTHAGGAVSPEGLVQRMFSGFSQVPAMYDLVRKARRAGLRTCLLSNSWGDSYVREGWDEIFDAIVISGEVGMRKPEERIYRHAAGSVGLPLAECVFVDDIAVNVQVARRLGMAAVHHQTPAETIVELEGALDIGLRV